MHPLPLPPLPPLLLGIDFTCAPSRRKPITVALGWRCGDRIQLDRQLSLTTLDDYTALLQRPGPWLAGCDFPFGLPRAFVDALGLGDSTAAVIAEVHRRCPTRKDWRRLIDAFGNSRPAGQRLLHRVTDRARPGFSSTSPLQTRYVPVGFMYYEGLSRLVDAGVTLPRMHEGDPARQALEAYPGLLAFELIGRRSYKNGDDGARLEARERMLDRLEQGHCLPGLRLLLSPGQRAPLLHDASGDRLDAVLCLVQAALAHGRPDLGMPAEVDPVEGWITGAGPGV